MLRLIKILVLPVFLIAFSYYYFSPVTEKSTEQGIQQSTSTPLEKKIKFSHASVASPVVEPIDISKAPGPKDVARVWSED